MNLIDTHCHLDFSDFDKDRESVIKDSKDSGIVRIMNVSSSIKSCDKTLELVDSHDFIYGSIGIHPHDASYVTEAVIGALKNMAKNRKIRAIGEVGLDYYRDLSPRDKQKDVFLRFIELSKELALPLIIHARNSLSETLEIIKDNAGMSHSGVFHCFSGDKDSIPKILDLGFYISFTCSLTFKNAHASRELAKCVPLERLLLETDAPFMAPQALRGKRNVPANLVYLLEVLSEIKKISKEELANKTNENADRLFKLNLG